MTRYRVAWRLKRFMPLITSSIRYDVQAFLAMKQQID